MVVYLFHSNQPINKVILLCKNFKDILDADGNKTKNYFVCGDPLLMMIFEQATNSCLPLCGALAILANQSTNIFFNSALTYIDIDLNNNNSHLNSSKAHLSFSYFSLYLRKMYFTNYSSAFLIVILISIEFFCKLRILLKEPNIISPLINLFL